MRLQEKVSIITGSGSGIGRGIAARFAVEGATVVCADVDERGAAETARVIVAEGGRALPIAADVSQRDQVEALVCRTVTEFGRLDIMVANAGIFRGEPFLETTDETWEQVMATNARGVFLCCQAAAKRMVEGGRGGKIITVSSVYSEITGPGAAAYTASKGAVRMLTHSMALELAPYHINVNSIAPGAIDTPMLQVGAPDEASRKQFVQLIPWGRLGEPRDIANAALFLASDEADYVTGETLFVDGGWLTQ